MNQLPEIPFEKVSTLDKLIMTDRKHYGDFYSTCRVYYLSDKFIRYYLNAWVLKTSTIEEFKKEYMILEIVPRWKVF